MARGYREPPKTAFRRWVDDGRSIFGLAGFMAVPSVGVFLTVNLFSHGTRSSTSENPCGRADREVFIARIVTIILFPFHFFLICPELFTRFPEVPMFIIQLLY